MAGNTISFSRSFYNAVIQEFYELGKKEKMSLMPPTLSKRNPRAHLVLVLGCSKARATMLCNASSVGCSVRLRPLRLLTVSMAGSHGGDPLFEASE